MLWTAASLFFVAEEWAFRIDLLSYALPKHYTSIHWDRLWNDE